jgi:hypothetical protein
MTQPVEYAACSLERGAALAFLCGAMELARV